MIELSEKVFGSQNVTNPFGYEKHMYSDSAFPIIFHFDTVRGDIFAENEQGTLFHWHENIEILQILKGKAKINLGGKFSEYEENEIAVINSGVFHKVEAVGDEVNYYCLIVDCDFLKTRGIDIENNFFSPKIADEEMNEYMNIFAHEFFEKTQLHKTKCLALATLICIKMFEKYCLNSGEINYKEDAATMICRSVIKYINEKFNTKISMDTMAKKIGVSKFHMCRSFKKCTGCSIVEYINIYRVEQTKKIIALRDVNVSEAAVRCGFSNMSYFTKVFKKVTGMAPGEYKKQINFEKV